MRLKILDVWDGFLKYSTTNKQTNFIYQKLYVCARHIKNSL